MTGHLFEYAVVRVVPRVDRGETMNAGAIVFCRAVDFLGARIELDRSRLRALDPSADAEAIAAALDALADNCSGAGGAAGPAAGQDIGKRFRWLTAPRSTVVQTGPVHTGLTTNPADELNRLLERLVRTPA